MRQPARLAPCMPIKNQHTMHCRTDPQMSTLFMFRQTYVQLLDPASEAKQSCGQGTLN
jgi:hypothetical protein